MYSLFKFKNKSTYVLLTAPVLPLIPVFGCCHGCLYAEKKWQQILWGGGAVITGIIGVTLLPAFLIGGLIASGIVYLYEKCVDNDEFDDDFTT